MPATLVLNLIKIQGLVEEIDQKNKVAYFDIRRLYVFSITSYPHFLLFRIRDFLVYLQVRDLSAVEAQIEIHCHQEILNDL